MHKRVVRAFAKLTDEKVAAVAIGGGAKKGGQVTVEEGAGGGSTDDQISLALELFAERPAWGAAELRDRGIKNPSTFFQRPMVCAKLGCLGGFLVREKTSTGTFEAQQIGDPRKAVSSAAIKGAGKRSEYFWDPPESWLVRSAIANKLPVVLVGPPGCGKTTLLEHVMREELGEEPYDLNLNGEMSVSDFFGVRSLKNGNTVWDYGPLTLAMKEKKPIIVNELDAAPPEILYCLYRVLEKKDVKIPTFSNPDGTPMVLWPWNGEKQIRKKRNRKTGKIREVEVEVESKFVLAATANTVGRGDDSGLYRGAQVLNEAFLDRYSLFLRLGYPPKEEEAGILVRRTGIRKETADKIAEVASLARQAVQGDSQTLTCTFSVRKTLNWADSIVTLGCSVEQGFVSAVMQRSTKEDADALAEIYQRVFGEKPDPSCLAKGAGKKSTSGAFDAD